MFTTSHTFQEKETYQQVALKKIEFFNSQKDIPLEQRINIMAQCIIGVSFNDEVEKMNFVIDVWEKADVFEGRLREICRLIADSVDSDSLYLQEFKLYDQMMNVFR